MTEGRVAAAGSYLVQGRDTHDSAQDDLDAGHAGSDQEEVEMYCAMMIRLALRCDMRTAVCRGKAGRERLQAPPGWVASVCPDTPTTTPRLSSALDMLCCAVLCRAREGLQQSRRLRFAWHTGALHSSPPFDTWMC